jgi:hypothetical protein
MDIFLGVFVPQPGSPHIWELDSDLHLHNSPQPFLDAPLPSALPAVARRPTSDEAGTGAEAEAEAEAGAEAEAKAPAGAARQPNGEVASESGAGGGGAAARPWQRGPRDLAPFEVSPAAATEAEPGPARLLPEPTGQSLFDAYYQPEQLTSFDDLLSRAFAAPLPGSASVAAAVKHKARPDAAPATDAAEAGAAGYGSPVQTPGQQHGQQQAAAQLTGEGPGPTDEAGGSADLGGGFAAPEWTRRSTLLDDVARVPLGDLRVMLPKGYLQLDEYRAHLAQTPQPAAAQVYLDFLKQAEQLCHAVEPRKEGDPPDPSSEFYASALDPLI